MDPGGGEGGGGDAEGQAAAATESSACWSCSCLCCTSSSLPSAAWCRSMKRKMDEKEAEARSLSSVVAGGGGEEGGVARVEIENEAAALREALASHQQSIKELYGELEEERSASASATTEAMSMILRLQREKAETQMEARQFKRLAEEKMFHDQQEIAALEDLISKREQSIQSLSCEVQAYHHLLLSYGIGLNGDATTSELPLTPNTATAAAAGGFSQFDLPPFDYPPLRCTIPQDDSAANMEKYPFGETPREHLQKIEQRIHELERMPSSSRYSNVMEKVVVGYSPRRPRHLRRFSVDSYGSGLEFNRGEEIPMAVDRVSECGGRDDLSDRVYTVDAVHGAADDYVSTPREAQNRKNPGCDGGDEEAEIKKLYMRLQTLEADRESMRQAIISMSTDKAQVVLLKEIAQHLCKEVTPQKKTAKKRSFIQRFSIIWVVKCVISFVFWRKKPSRIKYNFGVSSNNVGLLLLLDQSPCLRHRRFLSRMQG